MGFRSVYRVLQEVFPHVDSRVLRAVAIEHSKDADAAVEVVLVEVIPYLSKRSTMLCSSNESGSLLNPSEEAVVGTDTTSRTDDTLLCLDESSKGSSFYDGISENDKVHGDNGNDELISLDKFKESTVKAGPDMFSHATSITSVHENGVNDDHDQVCEPSESEEITSLRKCEESSVKVVGSDQSSHVTLTTLKHGDTDANGGMNGHLHAESEDLNGPADCDSKTAIHGESHKKQSCTDINPLEVTNTVVHVAPVPLKECVPTAPEGSLQLVLVPDTLITDFKKPESSLVDAASKKDTSTSEMLDLEDDLTRDTKVTRSVQNFNIDLLEDIIEDARNSKKTLSSAMDSVISLMREVEFQEKAAEQAKEEAARGGLDILARVEDLNQHLQRAKEANEMHAGEVYGEKAILATEVRELQSRLINLSDERDKSLAILDEMRQTLEVRLTAAEKEMKAAEQEKLEKEESAQKALVDQQFIMEKLVQESEILKREAEENSKLQEFLMDRGRVVDTLQGEMSVRCQDVKLLKEKFDERVPLSKYLSSSSQTSCILASSSSTLNGMALDQVPAELADSSETLKKTSATTPSIDYHLSSSSSSVKSIASNHIPELADSSETPKKSAMPFIDDQLSTGEERVGDDRRALVDDGWEFFDKHEFDM